jgi:hypothetical protein
VRALACTGHTAAAKGGRVLDRAPPPFHGTFGGSDIVAQDIVEE